MFVSTDGYLPGPQQYVKQWLAGRVLDVFGY